MAPRPTDGNCLPTSLAFLCTGFGVREAGRHAAFRSPEARPGVAPISVEEPEERYFAIPAKCSKCGLVLHTRIS